MKPALFALAFSLAAASAAAAQDMQWIGDRYDEGASLLYGLPESDAILIGFYCERATRRVAMSYEHEPANAADGVELDLKLAAAGRPESVTVRTVGHRLELDDKFVLEGETALTPALQRILTGGGTLTVTVAGKSEAIPLAGARIAARELLAACGRESS